MTATLLDGKQAAATVRTDLAREPMTRAAMLLTHVVESAERAVQLNESSEASA
jgi:hypothetical protein